MELGEGSLAKNRMWEEKQAEIDNLVDRLGAPIDEGIKPVVIGLNVHNLPTIASCEGHTDWGMNAPWVEIAASNEPEFRFKGEMGVYKKIAKKYNIEYDAVRHGENFEAWGEAITLASENDETKEYKAWKEKNKVLVKKAKTLLKEFYKGSNISPEIKITVDRDDGYHFRLFNGGDDYRPFDEKMGKKEQQKLSHRLKAYQEEMNRFASFLKEKSTHTAAS